VCTLVCAVHSQYLTLHVLGYAFVALDTIEFLDLDDVRDLRSVKMTINLERKEQALALITRPMNTCLERYEQGYYAIVSLRIELDVDVDCCHNCK
jgi:hypothetical protein